MSSAWVKEIVKVGAMTLVVVIFQLLMSVIGVIGIVGAVIIYTVTLAAATWIKTDLDGRPISRMEYFIFAITDVALVIVGVILWFVAGFLSGIERTMSNSYEDPSEYFHGFLHGSNFLIRVTYTFISHLTLVSFGQVIVNLVHAGLAK